METHNEPTRKNTPESVDDTRLNKRLKDMPIAIVGMASMFANSRYLNKFWDLISEKIDAITEVPDTHWRQKITTIQIVQRQTSLTVSVAVSSQKSTSTQWSSVFRQIS